MLQRFNAPSPSAMTHVHSSPLLRFLTCWQCRRHALLILVVSISPHPTHHPTHYGSSNACRSLLLANKYQRVPLAVPHNPNLAVHKHALRPPARARRGQRQCQPCLVPLLPPEHSTA